MNLPFKTKISLLQLLHYNKLFDNKIFEPQKNTLGNKRIQIFLKNSLFESFQPQPFSLRRWAGARGGLRLIDIIAICQIYFSVFCDTFVSFCG